MTTSPTSPPLVISESAQEDATRQRFLHLKEIRRLNRLLRSRRNIENIFLCGRTYADSLGYIYRTVTVPMYLRDSVGPLDHQWTSEEVAAIGLVQEPEWEHLMIHSDCPFVFVFRRKRPGNWQPDENSDAEQVPFSGNVTPIAGRKKIDPTEKNAVRNTDLNKPLSPPSTPTGPLVLGVKPRRLSTAYEGAKVAREQFAARRRTCAELGRRVSNVTSGNISTASNQFRNVTLRKRKLPVAQGKSERAVPTAAKVKDAEATVLVQHDNPNLLVVGEVKDSAGTTQTQGSRKVSLSVIAEGEETAEMTSTKSDELYQQNLRRLVARINSGSRFEATAPVVPHNSTGPKDPCPFVTIRKKKLRRKVSLPAITEEASKPTDSVRFRRVTDVGSRPKQAKSPSRVGLFASSGTMSKIPVLRNPKKGRLSDQLGIVPLKHCADLPTSKVCLSMSSLPNTHEKCVRHEDGGKCIICGAGEEGGR